MNLSQRLRKAIVRTALATVLLLGLSASLAPPQVFAQMRANTTYGVVTIRSFIGNITFNLATLFASGTVSAPGIAWSAETNTGLYRRASSTIGITQAGTETQEFNGTGIWNLNGYAVYWGATPGGGDLFLFRDGANTLALRNPTPTAQTLNIYSGSSAAIGLAAQADGKVNFTNQAATIGAMLDVSSDALAAFRTRAGTDAATLQASVVNATSSYQLNGNAFATGTIGPSAPVGSTSTALVMAGLGGSITTRTGRILLCMSGVMQNSGANDGSKAQMSYGTGGAPSNGAALTGTQIGPIQQYNASTLAAAASAPYGSCTIVTGLTKGTAYWFDTAFAAITAGTTTLTQAYMSANDQP